MVCTPNVHVMLIYLFVKVLVVSPTALGSNGQPISCLTQLPCYVMGQKTTSSKENKVTAFDRLWDRGFGVMFLCQLTSTAEKKHNVSEVTAKRMKAKPSSQLINSQSCWPTGCQRVCKCPPMVSLCFTINGQAKHRMQAACMLILQ